VCDGRGCHKDNGVKVSACSDFEDNMRCRTMRTWYALVMERRSQVHSESCIGRDEWDGQDMDERTHMGLAGRLTKDAPDAHYDVH
jgi:hypothetical protein